MSTKRLMPRLENLIDILLDTGNGDELPLFRAGAAMVALNVAGVPAILQQSIVVLDPEQWTRPHHVMALKIRGAVYAGGGRYGWDTIAEALREHHGVAGHYLDIGKPSNITIDQITGLNAERLDQWQAELDRAREIVKDLEPGLRVQRPKR